MTKSDDTRIDSGLCGGAFRIVDIDARVDRRQSFPGSFDEPRRHAHRLEPPSALVGIVAQGTRKVIGFDAHRAGRRRTRARRSA
ncbi:hypothetical protein [Burkholderia pseudomultivorans]|uniref:hypothetical protein n=1 Tax=Burkholderia pseudomultivorans TaxID=1207504 RepID=UPI001581EBD1|nr:hypothetical protein [Burkholderia pseudomultivorans]